MAAMRWGIVLVGALAYAGQVGAADLHVPGTFATIQAAIAAAQDGDVVRVAPGTYLETLDFLGKAIHVLGEQGPHVTIVDAMQLGTVVTFATGEGPASVLEGFTLRGGLPPGFDLDAGGGGIGCWGASPTIRNNIVRENTTYWLGAGLHSEGGSPRIEGNVFLDNTFFCLIADAPCGWGGGVHCIGGSPVITGNRFQNNTAFAAGGAIALIDTTGAVVVDCVVRQNVAGDGGGVFVSGGTGTVLRNNLIVGNRAWGYSTLLGRVPGSGGGVGATNGATVSVQLCTVAANEALDFTGGGRGGGLDAELATISLENCIVWGNLAQVDIQLHGVTAVTYTNVQGGLAGTGNLNVDPRFVSGPESDHYLSQVAAGQALDSPCVDAGNPLSALPAGGTTRTDQVTDAGVVDMGFHRVPAVGSTPNLVRGDCNVDGSTNIADAVALLGHLFPPAGTPGVVLECRDACDANDDGTLNISDAVVLLSALFGMPPTPLPAPTLCGIDPTADGLDCGSFSACP